MSRIKKDGTVWMWGVDIMSRFRVVFGRNEPVKVEDLEDVFSIEVGVSCNFAVKTDGSVWVWGVINEFNEDDSGRISEIEKPELIDGLKNIVKVSAIYIFLH